VNIADLIWREMRRWRVLDGWRIELASKERPICDPPDDRVVNQCNHNVRTKEAIIAPWDGPDEELENYIIHEVLHCALAATRGDSEAEELMVQDLTEIVRGLAGDDWTNEWVFP